MKEHITAGIVYLIHAYCHTKLQMPIQFRKYVCSLCVSMTNKVREDRNGNCKALQLELI